MKDTYFFHHTNSRFFKISGDESESFIQNLITNDITKCSKDRIIYSCLLTPQGKFIADFFIFKQNNIYFFETDKKFYENLLQKLKIYKLRSKINIEEEENLFSYSIFNFDYNFNYLSKQSDPRNNNLGNKLILKNEIELSNDKIKIIDKNKYHEILILNNTPYSSIDLNENKSLLLENNFENLNAIDWEKGCYVGQEITARMKYRALLKKKLYPLKIKKGEASIDMELISNGNKIGEIKSIANSYIFAILNIEFVDELKNSTNILKLDDSLILEFLN